MSASIRQIDILCVCKGHTRTIPLINGSQNLRCRFGGAFKLTIEKIDSIEWKIITKSQRSSFVQKRFFIPE